MTRKDKINRIFKAIADPTRREIFHVLMIAGTAMSLTQIADHFVISRQGVTKHIKLLEEAGLIRIHEEGRERFCEANATPLHEIKNWMAVYDRFWDEKL
jgi:DNA-binding transcriptional ArsR family regulator